MSFALAISVILLTSVGSIATPNCLALLIIDSKLPMSFPNGEPSKSTYSLSPLLNLLYMLAFVFLIPDLSVLISASKTSDASPKSSPCCAITLFLTLSKVLFISLPISSASSTILVSNLYFLITRLFTGAFSTIYNKSILVNGIFFSAATFKKPPIKFPFLSNCAMFESHSSSFLTACDMFLKSGLPVLKDPGPPDLKSLTHSSAFLAPAIGCRAM